MTASLRPALDAEKRARDLLTYSEWGAGLTLEQYLEREQLLRAQAWAKSEMVTWLLVENQTVLASCETFRNHSSVGSNSGHSFSVASVFTESTLRRRGHCAQLMSLLVERLGREPLAQASVLFSDVGTKPYAPSGYRQQPAYDWVLPPLMNADGFDWLDQTSAPTRTAGADGQLVLHPSADQLDWHFERGLLYARFLSRPALQHRGACSPQAQAWWTASYKDDELLVLWLEAPDAAAAQPVLAAAQSQAHAIGVKRVRLWETFTLQSMAGAQRLTRNRELPMMAPLGVNVTDWNRIERALWV